MACENVKSWKWKEGEHYNPLPFDPTGNILQFNYFTCGTYYFDGDYYVVKFPKGMQLYNGSGPLANSVAEFPVGKNFYQPVDIATPLPLGFKDAVVKKRAGGAGGAGGDDDRSIEEVLFTDEPNPAVSWYSEPNVAIVYSSRPENSFSAVCGTKCLFVYELIRDTIFLQLDNNYNIYKLLSEAGMDTHAHTALTVMFDLQNKKIDVTRSKSENRIKFEKRRVSYSDVDHVFSQWFCKNAKLSASYAGYAADNQLSGGTTVLHSEFMFCNPMKHMRRNLSSPFDWQFYDTNSPPFIPSPTIRQYLQQLSYYKSYNVNFHAGNLMEHSIWSLLFAESILNNDGALLFNKRGEVRLDTETKRIIAAASFIHDIGKMTVSDPNVTVRKHDVVFYAIPDHPEIGAEYVLGTKRLPLLDIDMNVTGFLDVNDLIRELGFVPDQIQSLARLVLLHRKFGEVISKMTDTTDSAVDQSADEYISICGDPTNVIMYMALLTISNADILASQPFGMNNLTVELNHQSIFFPYIKNVPKKYRGGDIADKTAPIRHRLSETVFGKVMVINQLSK